MDKRFLLLLKKEEKILFAGLLTGIAMFVIYCLFFHVGLFSTSAKVFVRNIPLNTLVSSFGEGSTIKSESGYSNPLFNLKQVLVSDMLASELYKKFNIKYHNDVKKLGINSEYEWNNIFKKLISSKIEPSSDIIKISLNWPEKNNINSVLSDTIQEFKKVNLEVRKSIEVKQREYIDQHLDNIEKKLNIVRGQIKDYKQNRNVVDLENESVELTRARVDLEKQAEIVKSNINYYTNKMRNLSNQLNIPNAEIALRATAIGEDPYLIQLTRNLSDAQQRYAGLSAKFTENFPDVIAVKNEIDSLKQNVLKRNIESLDDIKISRGIYDKPSQDIVTDLARAQAETVSLKGQFRGLEKGIVNLKLKESSLPDKEFGLEELQKTENALLDAYTNIKKKQLEARIKENQIVDNIILLGMSSSPKSLVNVLILKFIGFISFGLFAALGICLIKDDIQDKWINAEEIELITGKKILGILPWIKEKNILGQNINLNSNSITGVTYGIIAQNIINRSYLEEAQSIAFISTNRLRFKSSIIPNIVATMSKLKRSVILIDTNFTSPAAILKNAGIVPPEDKKDLIDVINEINKYYRLYKDINTEMVNTLLYESIIPVNIKSDPDTNITFSYLSSNKPADNIHEYVSTKGFKAVVEFLKLHYEFVLIDTPAKPLICPEFSSITPLVDAVVLISALSTNKEKLIQVIERLENSNTKILGIVPREENSEIEKYFESLEKDKVSGSKTLANMVSKHS
jgi:uncharacterized protein involved in exopolysaccharide biosynthesis/Mrp family chromosome partitioning ATPase